MPVSLNSRQRYGSPVYENSRNGCTETIGTGVRKRSERARGGRPIGEGCHPTAAEAPWPFQLYCNADQGFLTLGPPTPEARLVTADIGIVHLNGAHDAVPAWGHEHRPPSWVTCPQVNDLRKVPSADYPRTLSPSTAVVAATSIRSAFSTQSLPARAEQVRLQASSHQRRRRRVDLVLQAVLRRPVTCHRSLHRSHRSVP